MLAPAFRRVWTWLGTGGGGGQPSLPPTVVVGRLLATGRRLAPGEAVALAAALGELAIWRGGGEDALPSFDAIGVDWSGRLVVLDEHAVGGDPMVQRLATLVAATTRGTSGARYLQALTVVDPGTSGGVPSLADWLERLDEHAPRNRRVVLAAMVERMRTDENQPAVVVSQSERSTSLDDARSRRRAALAAVEPAAEEGRPVGPLLWRSVGGFLAALGLVLLVSFLTLWTARSILFEQATRDSHQSADPSAAVDSDLLAPATVVAAERAREPLAAASGANEVSPPPDLPLAADAAHVSGPSAEAEVVSASDGGLNGQSTRVAPTPGRSSDQAYRPPLSRRSLVGGSSLVRETGATAVPTSKTRVGSDVAWGATAAVLWSRPTPQPFPVPASAAAAQLASPVYSSATLDVEPPRLTRVAEVRQREAADATDLRGTVELVIDETGHVEHVKLVAWGDYAEIQRVARAWRQAEFTPASREGRAVRFRTTLPLQPK